jgi:hypothetical protein
MSHLKLSPFGYFLKLKIKKKEAKPLSALGETISDRQLNIVLNGLPRSFDMVIQGISYMTNPVFEDVMGKILMEHQRMAIRDQKIGQDEALAIQTCPSFHRGRFTQHCGRGFARPTGLYYSHPAQNSYSHLTTLDLRNISPFTRPSTPYRQPLPTHAPTISSHPRNFRPHFMPTQPDQNFNFRTTRPPVICYSCGKEGHIA